MSHARLIPPPRMTHPGLHISISATTCKASTRNGGGMSTAAGGSSTACATPSPTGSPPPIGPAASRRHDAGISFHERRTHRPRTASSVSASTAGTMRVSPAIHWPRPCWRTMCTWLVAHSNIIGPEASCLPAPRNPMRWSLSIAARAGGRRTARHAGRTVRRPDRPQPEQLALASLRPGSADGFCLAAAVRRFLL